MLLCMAYIFRRFPYETELYCGTTANRPVPGGVATTYTDILFWYWFLSDSLTLRVPSDPAAPSQDQQPRVSTSPSPILPSPSSAAAAAATTVWTHTIRHCVAVHRHSINTTRTNLHLKNTRPTYHRFLCLLQPHRNPYICVSAGKYRYQCTIPFCNITLQQLK